MTAGRSEFQGPESREDRAAFLRECLRLLEELRQEDPYFAVDPPLLELLRRGEIDPRKLVKPDVDLKKALKELGEYRFIRALAPKKGAQIPQGNQRFPEEIYDDQPDALEMAKRIAKTAPESTTQGWMLRDTAHGEGGMGTVHLARQLPGLREVMAKTVQWKMLRDDPTWQERFYKEVLALSHMEIGKYVVTVYGLVPDRNNYYLFTEYLNPEEFEPLVRKEGDSGEPYTRHDLFTIFRQLAEFVDAVNAAGLDHMDLKPGNIRYNRKQGYIKIFDAGMSRGVVEYGKDLSVAYTPAYATPERVQGNVFASEDEALLKQQLLASEIFTLTTILFRMITGKERFASGDGNLLITVLNVQAVQELSEDEKQLIREQAENFQLDAEKVIALINAGHTPDWRERLQFFPSAKDWAYWVQDCAEQEKDASKSPNKLLTWWQGLRQRRN